MIRYPLISISIIAVAVAVAACTKADDTQKTANSNAPTPVSSTVELKTEKPLDPLFADAKSCLKECIGQLPNYDSPDTEFAIPRKFSDFLKGTDYGQDRFLNLLEQMPPDFMKFGVIGPDEHPGLEMSGWISHRLERNGTPIYIYTHVGLPEGVPLRRRAGSLIVAVNPKTKEMATVFNGEQDLSHYIFVGSSNLLSFIVAYISASEAETEKAYKISSTQQTEILVFPIPNDRIVDVERRLIYLNSIYRNGEITGAYSAYNAGEALRKVPHEKQWWVANSSFTECFESGGPAAKLDEFEGFTDKPRTQDYRNSSGNLAKVEVINATGSGQETVWTYYKEKSQCEAEQVNATKSLADRYR
ncbi:hypothetical protein [Candidatus Ferrigenium straubiae]|jgi:hypothetical protein|uniref:hypothetical protein n=1 Tax=Candidatus Ferrigenium straubiae TaxID=2919506 RepID=UPI003F4A8D5B